MKVSETIKSLRGKINNHNYQYYVLYNPIISDSEYDKLLKDLELIEKKYPEFIIPESPTQRIGAQNTALVPKCLCNNHNAKANKPGKSAK